MKDNLRHLLAKSVASQADLRETMAELADSARRAATEPQKPRSNGKEKPS